MSNSPSDMKPEIPDVVAMHRCATCGCKIQCGLCSYECPEDNTPLGERKRVVLTTYKLDTTEFIPPLILGEEAGIH